jgi:hypothetical protein
LAANFYPQAAFLYPYKKPALYKPVFCKSLSQRLLDFGGSAAANAAALLAGAPGQFTVGVKTAGTAQFAAHLADAGIEVFAIFGFIGSGGLFAALCCSCHRNNFYYFSW